VLPEPPAGFRAALKGKRPRRKSQIVAFATLPAGFSGLMAKLPYSF
jgi:hypothetical protein